MRSRALPSLIVVFAVACIAPGSAAAAKGKGKGGNRSAPVTASTVVNQLVPNASTTDAGVVRSTITFGKKLRGRSIGDVDVTVQTTGVVPQAAEDVTVRLSAPNGATTTLFVELAGQSIGPLTLDDDTPVRPCASDSPPCSDPDQALLFPYIGTAAPMGSFQIMERGPIRGTWTLTILDVFGFGGRTSVFNSWGLRITPGR